MVDERFPWRRTWSQLTVNEAQDTVVLGIGDDIDSRPLSHWHGTRCLVLLGEGGLGKTDELREERRRLIEAGEDAHLVDMGRTTDRYELTASVLPQLRPGAEATLLIDGFDEVFADVADIADVLSSYLDTLDPSHVSVRIASRPAIWSTRLEQALKSRWADTLVLVLRPPSRSDIAAASEMVLDRCASESFMTAVAERDLWTLASSPITLEFLLDAFRTDATLPSDRLALYRDGVARLVSERHGRRVDRRRTGAPTPERLHAARTVAFLSLFSGRPTLSTRPLSGRDYLDLDDVAGVEGHAMATLTEFAQSGVLRPAGSDAVTWSHRSFAEFLAAERARDLPLPTLLNLLAQPTSPQRIAPPLTAIGSWVACTRRDLFEWLVDHDVEVLLDANLSDAPADRRRKVARAVIASILSGRGFDLRRASLSALAHDDLADDVRGPLADPTVAAEAKAEILQLLWHARSTGLSDQLIELVRSAAGHGEYGEIVSLGRWAVIALSVDCTDAIDSRLMGMAIDSTTNKWIRADLLERLYPRRIDTAAMLQLIPAVALWGFDSTFAGLVRRACNQAAEDVDALVALLTWLAGQPEHAHHDHEFRQAFDAAAAAAGVHLDDARVVDALARLLARHAERGHDVRVPVVVRNVDVAQRRRLVAAVAAIADEPAGATRMLGWYLADAQDFDHYFDLAVADGAVLPAADHWAISAAYGALMGVEADRMKATIEATKRRHPGIAGAIEAVWGEEWRARRVEALESAARTARSFEPRRQDLFDPARLSAAIAAESWHAAAYELDKPVVEGPTSYAHLQRLSHGTAWQQLGTTLRADVVDLAAKAATALPADQQHMPAIARAIGLVMDAAPGRLDLLPPGRWSDLLPPLMVGFPEDPEVCALVVDKAMNADAVSALKVAIAAIEDDVASQHALALDRLGAHRPQELDAVMCRLVADPQTGERPVGRMLDDMLDRDVPGAAQLAMRIIGQRPGTKPPMPKTDDDVPILDLDDPSNVAAERRRWNRAVAAAAALVLAPARAVAGVDLLAVLTEDWEFTCDIARRLGSHFAGELLPSLSPEELAELYLWIDARIVRRQLAPGVVYEVDAVQDLPNTILHTIGQREDDHAAAALDRIGQHCSSAGIREYAKRVQRASDTASWRPVPVAELRGILQEAERRVIATPAQLAAVVREALEDYAAVVRTNAAVRRRLWIPTNDGHRPRTEEEVSDELGLEIKNRLGPRVAANREVRIEPRLGARPASEVDLLVTVYDGGTTVSCVVEVKANWYPKLISRISAQLVDRYLAGAVSDSGVFAVLWFAGEDWSASDPRRRKALRARRRFDRALTEAMAVYATRPVYAVVVDCTLEGGHLAAR